MIRLILGLMILSSAAYAEQAPQGCQDHFLKGEMPIISPTAIKSRQICFEEFAVLHSGFTKTPIWVAERLTAERIAQAKHMARKDAFHAEGALPVGERAELKDYARSGYARGHMAPSADMPTPSSQRESFSLANMIPQNNKNNSVYWSGIEKKVRELTSDGDDIYVVTGPIFLNTVSQKTIGNGVMVPQQIFKAIYDPTEEVASAYVVTNETMTQCQIVSLTELKERYGVDAFPELPRETKEKTVGLPTPRNLVCRF